MLVLNRRRDEVIVFGDKVRLTIVDIRRDRVRLGFNAPREIPIHRQEVFAAICRETNQNPEFNKFVNSYDPTSCKYIFTESEESKGELEVSGMLVLSRRKSEIIRISDDIFIQLLEIRGDTVRIGIDAPRKLPVHRKEVYDAIKRSTGQRSILQGS